MIHDLTIPMSNIFTTIAIKVKTGPPLLPRYTGSSQYKIPPATTMQRSLTLMPWPLDGLAGFCRGGLF
jgi:hypothetical protein